MAYAIYTKVPVDQTRLEIERTLLRYGANGFAYMSSGNSAAIVFEAHDRRIKFVLPLPADAADRDKQAARSRWR